MDLRKESMYFKHKFKKISFEQLTMGYEVLSKVLNEKYFLERSKTLSEVFIHKTLSEYTRLKIHDSFWIGKRNYDLFIPSVKSTINKKSFKGLVIEVDGTVHTQYIKMRRDQSKNDSLYKLGIGCTVVLNEYKRDRLVDLLLRNVSSLKKLDTRAKNRLMRNIYIHTLIAHKDLIDEQNLILPKSILKILEIL